MLPAADRGRRQRARAFRAAFARTRRMRTGGRKNAFPVALGAIVFPPPLAGAFGEFAPCADSGLRGAGRADGGGGEPDPENRAKIAPVALDAPGRAILCWIPIHPRLPTEICRIWADSRCLFPPRPSIPVDCPFFSAGIPHRRISAPPFPQGEPRPLTANGGPPDPGCGGNAFAKFTRASPPSIARKKSADKRVIFCYNLFRLAQARQTFFPTKTKQRFP